MKMSKHVSRSLIVTEHGDRSVLAVQNRQIDDPPPRQVLVAVEAAGVNFIDVYQRQGRYAATVDPKIIELEQDRVNLVFEINEGPATKVKGIHFVGNHAFSDSQLRDVISTTEKGWFDFIKGTAVYDPDRMNLDRELLRQYYLKNGYADAQITDVKIDRLDKKNVVVTIYITEGQQYHVGTLSVEGLHIVSEANFRKVIKVTEGKVFSPQKLQKDIKSVEDAYGVAGYADAKVNVQTTPAGPSIVNLSYKVDEGIQSFVEHINISGNSRTKDKVLRREIILSPGDVFDTVRVDISKKRLEGLQYFERVDTYASDTAVPGRKDLNVVVQEKRTGNLNFGLGFSTTDGLLGSPCSSARRKASRRLAEPSWAQKPKMPAGFDGGR